MSKILFVFRYILAACAAVLTLSSVLPTLVLAQGQELSVVAAADDANEDGLLQKNEVKHPARWDWKANFNQIDCDSNSGLDGAEIERFKNHAACPNQGSGTNIWHQKAYPTGSGPFPAVVALHSSGGFKGSRSLMENFRKETWLKAGYAWYAPNFFDRHGITNETRMETFDNYRENIEEELAAIVALMKTDPKIDGNKIFAIGFSNGGFWASFLAGKGIVAAAASHYGVWKACMGLRCYNEYPVKYFSSTSTPLLALHGSDDSTQRLDYYFDAHAQIKDTPKFEDHIYEGAGHTWDCFPHVPKWLLERRPKRMPRLLRRLKRVCANKFDGPNREVTDDALKRTIGFFRKHAQ